MQHEDETKKVNARRYRYGVGAEKLRRAILQDSLLGIWPVIAAITYANENVWCFITCVSIHNNIHLMLKRWQHEEITKDR